MLLLTCDLDQTLIPLYPRTCRNDDAGFEETRSEGELMCVKVELVSGKMLLRGKRYKRRIY